ncbi:hypothetical protein Q7P35_008218 [Cladosporium inversicolor]
MSFIPTPKTPSTTARPSLRCGRSIRTGITLRTSFCLPISSLVSSTVTRERQGSRQASAGRGQRRHADRVRYVSYDTEYGFQLLHKADPLTASLVIRTQGHQSLPRKMQPDHSHQVTLFASMNQEVSFGVGAAWKERGVWKTSVSSLGKHITTADAVLFAIDMIMKSLVSTLSKADHSIAEIVKEPRIGLIVIRDRGQWTLPVVASIRDKHSPLKMQAVE